MDEASITSEIASMDPIFLLLSGYFRYYIKSQYKIKMRVPSILIDLIYKFYPKYFPYLGKFITDECTHGNKIQITDDCNISMNGYVSSIRLNLGISIADKSNYYWMIKISSNSHCNGYHFIGMVPNTTTNFNDAAYDGLNHAYGISGNPALVFRGKGRETVKDWNAQIVDHMVRVEFNGEDNNMIFKIPELYGERILYTIEIPKDLENVNEWFPCISIANSGNTAQLYFE